MLHFYPAMRSKTVVVSLTLLVHYITALPAGPGYWPNGTYSPTSDFQTAAAYSLIDTYDASNWLNKFDVQAIADPTHGFVEYVNAQQAQQLGLLKTQGKQLYMGVDSTSFLNPQGPGRKSVRVQSKTAYNRALVIADFAHVPGSACGSWPAFWMVGPNWPNQGEIDIYEGVHQNTYNQATLHTSPGCTPTVGAGGETGHRASNVDCGAGGGYNGCGVQSSAATSYGTAFNANGGGVYATLWTSSGIKVWYFASRNVPANIRSGNPNPGNWGAPMASFAGCDFDAKFRDLNIVFDISFCGDWAGGVWGQTACSQINPSCNAYVASQPQSFGDSYWLVNSVKVYSV
ncbi:glycoside hydrolase family 16 protein [Dothidotthia symphoricarpi CBS 119687]|uniref:endo-1,3(4)-beta-glucanase n=1 Tax=Dothidotthia symphoricarpi CBS 119687 TaxID=1392245 RepID=A0A6A6AK48_9PLEO|nr:glycoside hydrolase family 16 protein [Dothidotthia symphoricarpi CBS 119687]KAF2132329.1 glycoside hydrolase family 16 protein [Dothidotthia symphoricarpi CBS 119687]